MTILHGDDRVYNNVFIQNWPVKDAEVKEDMGFMTVDNQVVGTDVFNEFPDYDEWVKPFDLDGEPNMFTMQDYHYKKLPVWIDGNAYFNGAKPWNREANYYENTEDTVFVNLEEKNGHYRIHTNLYEFLDNFKAGTISTKILGKAFEPEEYFENPDGTPIVFNKDYFGNHRTPFVVPGPFEQGNSHIELV